MVLGFISGTLVPLLFFYFLHIHHSVHHGFLTLFYKTAIPHIVWVIEDKKITREREIKRDKKRTIGRLSRYCCKVRKRHRATSDLRRHRHFFGFSQLSRDVLHERIFSTVSNKRLIINLQYRYQAYITKHKIIFQLIIACVLSWYHNVCITGRCFV